MNAKWYQKAGTMNAGVSLLAGAGNVAAIGAAYYRDRQQPNA
jgi:hypothetical protein